MCTRKLLSWFVWVTPKTRYMGTRVSGIRLEILLSEMDVLGDEKLCIPNDRPKQKLFELHDNGYASHRGYTSTLAKALEMFWWRRIRQDVIDYQVLSHMCSLSSHY
jgi:hypothetical protein